MPITTTYCPVSRTDVVRVTDLEGATVRVVCPQYEEGSASCRLKTAAGKAGPLSQLLERAQERTLGEHGQRCDLV